MSSETLPAIRNSIISQWIDASSPSPHESVIEMNYNGERIRENDQNGNRVYKKRQKRYYQKNKERIYEDWKRSFSVLIQTELLDNHKKVPSLWTFMKYRPNYIQKGGTIYLKWSVMSASSLSSCTKHYYGHYHLNASAPNQAASITMHPWEIRASAETVSLATFRYFISVCIGYDKIGCVGMG